MWISFWCILVCYAALTDSYKILVVFPFPNKSHAILGHGMVKRLLAAGHEVTYITPLPEKQQHPNLHQIDVSDNFNHFPGRDLLNLEKIIKNNAKLNDLTAFYSTFFAVSNDTVGNENFKKFINDQKQTFDLIIIEWMFSEILAGLSSVFNCPYIWFSSMEPHWMILALIDEIPSPAYNTDILSVNSAPLSFAQRVTELYTQIKTTIYKKIFYANLEETVYENGFKAAVSRRGGQLPPYELVIYNASLVLSNSHVSMGEATRLPQSYQSIGGYHIDDNVTDLPLNLQEIMNRSENGVIYFSMGSNLQSKDLPHEVKRDLLRVFAGLKQTVLWKFEENFSDIPKNVHVAKWFLQPSVLAHPNCILFITHGGLLSTTETIHFGVPIIGIPAFADQFINIGRAVKKGFALEVDLSYNLADDLKVAIDTMITDPRYSQRVKELSWIYHERGMSAGAALTHWVNHVVETRGAPHLRSPALMLAWYQKLYLDLAAIFFTLAVLLFVIVKRLFSKTDKKFKQS